jgi:hypothetical protein
MRILPAFLGRTNFLHALLHTSVAEPDLRSQVEYVISKIPGGTTYRDGRLPSPGICELLGLKPFTPHDLRRTAATMCEYLRLLGGDIALCLDHQSSKDENGNDWPVVTQDVYSLAFEARVARKCKVLDAWAAELRRIVGVAEEAGQRLAA